MTTSTLAHKPVVENPRRQRILGAVFLIFGLLIYALFARPIAPGVLTTFGMTPGGLTRGYLGDWILPANATLNILAALSIFLGIYQLFKGFGKWTNAVLGLVTLFLVFGFLVFSAAGKSLNLGGMLSNIILLSVPITLGAFCGLLSERAGVINIAIEGMMLTGAMFGALVGSVAQNPWIGLIAAVLSGAVLALVHGILSIKYKVNQIISGTVINIFATGFTSYISAKFLQKYAALNNTPTFGRTAIPGLADIPLIGPTFFNTNFFVYAMLILLVVIQIVLFSTKAGLRLRAVGEHPKAADTLGINVFRIRYTAVLLSGMMAGFAGAYFTIGSVGRFDEMMTAGKGFIGLAAMIFGNWSPIGSFAAGLLFGLADTVGSKLSILGSTIPPQFMAMAPYITTMIVLAGVIGRGHAPAADGEPYEKE